MPTKYVDEDTGELIREVLLGKSGAPSAYGITTIEDLVRTAMPRDPTTADSIFFKRDANGATKGPGRGLSGSP